MAGSLGICRNSLCANWWVLGRCWCSSGKSSSSPICACHCSSSPCAGSNSACSSMAAPLCDLPFINLSTNVSCKLLVDGWRTLMGNVLLGSVVRRSLGGLAYPELEPGIVSDRAGLVSWVGCFWALDSAAAFGRMVGFGWFCSGLMRVARVLFNVGATCGWVGMGCVVLWLAE